MNEQQKDLVRYILNGIVSICIIVLVSLAFAVIVAEPVRSAPAEPTEPECTTCGCVSKTESINIAGNLL